MSVARTCPTCGYHHKYATEALADTHHPRHSCQRHRALADAAQRRADRVAGRTKRDCTHPGHPHQHGTRAAYVKDRCHCTACTAANTAASHNTARELTFGRWSPFIDVTAARDHIDLLRRAHLGYEQIARLSGTSFTHIREIAGTVARSGNRPPITQIRQDLADRILTITPDPSNRAPQSQVDALGTRRRLQALVAIGWPTDTLADRVGRTPANLRRTMTAATVTARTAQIVDDLYNELWDGGVLRNRNARRAWFDAAATVIGAPGLTPHELRHTAASLAVSAGANVKAVQRTLGHASAAVTLDIYADLFDDDLDAVAERLDDVRDSARQLFVAKVLPQQQVADLAERRQDPAGQ